jgi:hypothetical protein
LKKYEKRKEMTCQTRVPRVRVWQENKFQRKMKREKKINFLKKPTIFPRVRVHNKIKWQLNKLFLTPHDTVY